MRASVGLASAVVAMAIAIAVPPAIADGVTRTTYRVPVTQPDESGGGVELDVDVYRPAGAPPAGGWPFVMVFHGGGSTKDSPFDAGHARAYAEHGYVSLLYSARGHGGSSGQTTIAGPKEQRDIFDVAAWAMGLGGRTLPAHPSFGIDPSAVALAGYSQGGLHTNLAQVWAADPQINPYGIRFAALQPGNTPDRVFDALIDHGVVKLSFGVALLGLYYGNTQGRVAPVVDRWIATAAADEPSLYGGDVCDLTGHDQPGSTTRSDLAARSMGCRLDRMTLPTQWMQAFDDTLFPADMAIDSWRKMPDRENRLYLSMGGHGAPSAIDAIEQEKTDEQLTFLGAVLAGRSPDLPRVVYWARDPRVAVPTGAAKYPEGAWLRATAPDWPPPRTQPVAYGLGAGGRARPAGAQAGSVTLTPAAADPAGDPAAVTLAMQIPLGATLTGELPPTQGPGAIAAFATDPVAADSELAGTPSARLPWTPASADSQLVLRVLDEAPDGRLTLLGRGVQGVRGASPGTEQEVRVRAHPFASLIPAGHRMVVWVSAGDASFYKAYPGSAGGSLRLGGDTVVDLPLRDPAADAAGSGCTDRTAPRSTLRLQRLRVSRRGLSVAGTARDAGACHTAVRRVTVAIARAQGKRCRFLDAHGGLGPGRSCLRSRYIRARGTTSWRLSLHHGLRPGRYKLWSRATDRAGNVERKRRIGNLIRFTLR